MATIPNPTRHNPGQHQQHGSTSATGFGETLQQAASSVGDVASTVAHTAQDAWDSTRQGVSQGAGYVADMAGDFWGDATNMVRRYPVASVLIAFGLGCLCAGLFRVPNWSDDLANRMSRSSM